MKNKILLFLILLSSISFAQVSNGGEQQFDYGIKNNASTEIATPPFLVSQGIDGTYGKMNRNNVIEYLEFASAINLPINGVEGKLYLTKDNSRLYRWNGTIYVDVTADISGKENSANKQNSLAVDGTGVKFPTVDAVNTGLSTKISGTGTTNFIPKFTGSGTVENSRLFDDGVNIGTNSGNSFLVGDLGSDNYFRLIAVPSGSFIQYATGNATGGRGTLSFTGLNGSNTTLSLLPSGRVLFNGATDNLIDAVQINGNITASPATLPNQVVVKSQLDLKADLASPALTGTPTAPTATAGTNTTQIATTAFVTNADSGNVKLAGTQTITGQKTLISPIVNNQLNLFGSGSGSGIISFIGTPDTSFTQTGIARIGSFMAFIGSGGSTKKPLLFDGSLLNTVSRTVRFQDADGTVALTSNLLYTNQTITANKTVTIAEFVNNNELILSVNATSGNITITLPTFTALQGYKVTVKKMDSSANSVLIQGVGGVNIDGSPTLVISGQYSTSTVGANLSQYIIL